VLARALGVALGEQQRGAVEARVQVPGIVRGGVTLVLSPLVGLIQDQVATLLARGRPAIGLTGPAEPGTYARLRFLARTNAQIFVYAAPERLRSRRFRRFLEEAEIRTVAVDEAHCISQWGHDFRPEYRKIAELRESVPNAVFIAVTATATPRVRRDIRRSLRLESPEVVVGGFDRPNICFSLFRLHDARRKVHEVLEAVPGPSIIYESTRLGVEMWRDRLERAGCSVAGYHGGMDGERRMQNQRAWMRGEVRVMVATNAFGMGIDRPDVRSVVHVGIPDSMEAYFQEAGRAGRDGRPAHAVLLVTPEALRARRMLTFDGIPRTAIAHRRRLRVRWAPMLRYAESEDCRRVRLVGWFGQRIRPPCAFCDVCTGRHRMWRSTASERTVLDGFVAGMQPGMGTRDWLHQAPGPSWRNRQRLVHLMQTGHLCFEDLSGERIRVIRRPRKPTSARGS